MHEFMHALCHGSHAPSCPPAALPSTRFDEEASRLLEELWRFGALEQHAAAEFTSALAARLEQLFAVPAGC